MKPSGRPFPSKYSSGRCALCKKPIVKGDLIQRLEKSANWWEDKAVGGRIKKVVRFSDYVHEKCLEERKEYES